MGGVADAPSRPDAGDILLVIHDFKARSSDELSLTKGDRVELLERDDEFGDGWFLGKHLINGNTGLFPEVYTRPAPKGMLGSPNAPPPPYQHVVAAVRPQTPVDLPTIASATTTAPGPSSVPVDVKAASTPAVHSTTAPLPLPLSSSKTNSISASSTPPSTAKGLSSPPSSFSVGMGSIGLNASQENQVLSETLNVINEHITDMRSPPNNGPSPPIATDSGSEYSSHIDHRMSYIQGEETDEEEEGQHSRTEVESWSADQVAEFLFTQGVEKHHCEVFRDQEITGEVLLGMDQTSLFIKAFDLGSVGRRLKTWQKIKSLQGEVNGQAPGSRRTTGTYGSDVGSDERRVSKGSKGRSRTNTLTNSVQALPPIHDRPGSSQTKRSSTTNTPRLDPLQSMSPVAPAKYPGGSPTRPGHEKRPSAASVRDMHHSRRHSSTDFRLTGSRPASAKGTPKLMNSGTFPQQTDGAALASATNHKKQPSFDRGWTLGSAAAAGTRRLSSTQDDMESDFNKAIADLDRGYFSGTEVDGRKRNVLKKRDSVQGSHSRGASYAEEQRVRAGTAMARHSRFGSVDFEATRDPTTASSAAHKYYGLNSSPHRRTASAQTNESIRPALPPKDMPSPAVTKLDGVSPVSPVSPINRQGVHGDWFSKPGFKPGSVGGLGLRAISDAVTGTERSKAISPVDSPNLAKDSPLQSPSRTGSSTPSAGPSFDLDSPDRKSPSTTMTAISARNPSKKKGKKETSAYQRGLQKIGPREAMMSADYSGWMWKKSSNLMTTWKKRLFVLKGRRLAYYYSEDDEQEQGLIDISFHRVLPADNERLTGLHATITGAFNSPAMPADSKMPTLAETEANADPTKESDATFIFKLVPPRAGLSRAVNFTKPTVHYFAVSNIKQGRLWMAALMKATIERDDTTPITTSYQQKTISLTKARQMRHRPPALMGLDEAVEDTTGAEPAKDGAAAKEKDANGLGIYNENDSGVSGLGRLGFQKVESARVGQFPVMGAETDEAKLPLSA